MMLRQREVRLRDAKERAAEDTHEVALNGARLLICPKILRQLRLLISSMRHICNFSLGGSLFGVAPSDSRFGVHHRFPRRPFHALISSPAHQEFHVRRHHHRVGCWKA